MILREEETFLREVGPYGELTVDCRLAALSADQSKDRLRRRVLRRDGIEAARIDTHGAWMDLASRKLRPPPAGARRRAPMRPGPCESRGR